MKTTLCHACGHDNRPDRRFCVQCGGPLGDLCAACATPSDPDARFCGNCGEPLHGAGAIVPAPALQEAERRQLTVMFCDLVASTTLAEGMDDEDLRDVIRRYYDACADTARRYEGHVANYVGDGVLLYFGYPRAHEDDAERAVRAGVDMRDQLERDFGGGSATLGSERKPGLTARIGIHTGPVVVGDLGSGEHREALAVGETVNLAARLQGVAAPDTVVISDATRRLVRGIFVLDDLGPQRLKGIGAEVPAYRVVQPSGVRSRLEVAAGRLTPFIGRDLELGTLLDRWERTGKGEGQAVLATGEAGVGKSRLVYQLRERLADQPHTWLECRCTPYTQDTAFHPIIALVKQGLAFQPADTVADKVGKLERALALTALPLAEAVHLVAAFLTLPSPAHYPPLESSPDMQRRKTIDTLAAWTLALGKLQPVVMLVEDLHWADPSSLELLGRLVEQSATARVLLVFTARPEFAPPWPVRSTLTTLQLAQLTKRQAREMVAAVSDEVLPAEVLEAIVARADGNPLFIEELTKAVVESRAARSVEAIPATLQDSLMARLDRLSAAKEVAQRAAVLGREFPYALVAATAGIEETALRQGLGRLIEAEILFALGEPPTATYTFKHALVQEAAYGSLLKRTRQELHGRVVRALVAQFPERAEAEPELVALHAEAAGLADEAVTYYQRAAEQAQKRSAHEETIAQMRKAIALLGTLPDGMERDRREAHLQLGLGASMVAVRGYAHEESEAPYVRARALCEAAGDVANLGWALIGLARFSWSRGQPDRAIELADQAVGIAEQIRDDGLVLAGLVQGCQPRLYQGRFAESVERGGRAITLHDPTRHRTLAFRFGTDQGVVSRGFVTWGLWMLGHPDRALARAQEAVALARTLAHPFSLGFALFWETVVHWLRGHGQMQRKRAREVIALSEAQGFPLWLGLGRAFRAEGAGAVTEVMEGLAQAAGTGNQGGVTALLAWLAETQVAAGQHAEALGTIQTGLAIGAQRGEHYFEAELHRLQGQVVLALQPGSETEAERLFRRALEIAGGQEARSLELRAAVSLALMLAARGRRTEARALLAPIYDWFTEGFDTRDLVQARALLADLAAQAGEPQRNLTVE